MKISVAQALLILIDNKSKILAEQLKIAKDSKEKNLNKESIESIKLQIDKLKKLYLCGAIDDENRLEIANYLKDPILNLYEVSFEPDVIDNDSSRRYFETHLAYETLASQLDKLTLIELEKHLQLVKETAPDYYSDLYTIVLTIKQQSFGDNTEKEYGFYLKKLRDNEIFTEFSEESRKKLAALVSSAFVAMIIADSNPNLFPLDIYGEGIYRPEERGNKVRAADKKTSTSALGLLKSHMPLARDDAALMQKPQNFLKPSDQSTFKPDAPWVRDNFSRLVHPFSNSISGTLLCQLRALLKIKGTPPPNNSQVESIYSSTDKMKTFLTVFIAALLFNSGGHSLHEFVSPLGLDKVKDAFADIQRFDTFTLEELFLTNNQDAFDVALSKAIDYNNQILKITAVNEEIKQLKKEYDKRTLEVAINTSTFKAETRSNFLHQLETNIDSLKICFELSVKMQNLIVENRTRVSGEYFSFYRQGVIRHQLLEKKLNGIIEALSHGNLTGATKLIEETVTDLETFKSSLFLSKKIPELAALVAIQKSLRGVVDACQQMEIGKP